MLPQELGDFSVPTSVPVVGQFDDFESLQGSGPAEGDVDLLSRQLTITDEHSDWDSTYHFTLKTPFQIHDDFV
jgi:hypothetical protein